jgi:hypothetical protein
LVVGHLIQWLVVRKQEKIARLQRYGNELQTAHWTEDELADQGYNLRTSIETAQAVAHHVRQRLRRFDNPIPPEELPANLFIAPAAKTQTPRAV